MAYGLEEAHLVISHRGKDQAGTSAEVLAGGCLVTLGFTLLHTIYHIEQLLIHTLEFPIPIGLLTTGGRHELLL